MRRTPVMLAMSARAVRALPFGRYRAAAAISRLPWRPFRAQLPAALGGAVFVCDVKDSIAREAFFTGRYEPQETLLFPTLAHPGDVVIDVGANWGYFTLLAAGLVGPAGRVIGLEPNPRLEKMLARNVEMNRAANVEVLRAAAASRSCDQPFMVPGVSGNSGLSRQARQDEPVAFTAPAVPLDDLVAERGLGRVALVKIDVEGAELDVLQGMRGGLARHAFRQVLLEFHPRAFPDAAAAYAAIAGTFATAGYRGWHIDHSPGAHRRAARGRMAVADLLAPVSSMMPGDAWPHMLWSVATPESRRGGASSNPVH